MHEPSPLPPDAEPAELGAHLGGLGFHAYVGEVLPDDSYRGVWASPGLGTLVGEPFGTPGSSLLGAWEACIHPDDRSRYDAGFRYAALDDGAVFETRYRLIGRDGVLRTVRERYRASHVDERILIEGVIEEAEGPRGVIDELAEAHYHLERLAAALGEAHYTAELDDRGDWRILYASAGWEALLGRVPARGQPVADALRRAIVPDDRERFDDHLHALARGESAALRLRIATPAGERWIEGRAQPRLGDTGRLVAEGLLMDISERVRAEDELRTARSALSRIATWADEVFYAYELEPDGRYTMLMSVPGHARLMGLKSSAGDPDELAALWDGSVHPGDRAAYDATTVALLRGEPVEIEYRLIGADGAVRWIWSRSRPTPREGGGMLVEGVAADVTARRAAAAALEGALAEAERLSQIDSLTGLPNRRCFERELEAACAAAAAGSGPRPAVLLLDLDRFKAVNDAHGHRAGDAVLIEVARRLQRSLREGDLVARWGGEEFAVLISEEVDDATLRQLADQVRTRVAARPFTVEGEVVRIRLSAGAARLGDEWNGADALVDAADVALYAAKRGGRNRTMLRSEI